MAEYQILPRETSSGGSSVEDNMTTRPESHSGEERRDDDGEEDDIVEIDFTKSSPYDLNTSMKKSEEKSNRCQMAIIVYQRAIPLALTFSLGNVANFIMLYFAGHLPAEEEGSTETFAGVSMSILFSNISCLSIFVGMTGAVETLGTYLPTSPALS